MCFFNTRKELTMPLKIQSTTQNFNFDHDYLTAISKLLRQTQTQMLDHLTDVDGTQANEFAETIDTPVKAATTQYNDLYGDDAPQKSLLITYVRPFSDHILSRYLLETKHYVRSSTDISNTKDHLSDLIQANKIVVHVVPLSAHATTEQVELEPFDQFTIVTIFDTFSATAEPTTYLNELLAFNPSNWGQSNHFGSEMFGDELPLIKQAAIQLTGNNKIFEHIDLSGIADAQRLVKLLLMV